MGMQDHTPAATRHRSLREVSPPCDRRVKTDSRSSWCHLSWVISRRATSADFRQRMACRPFFARREVARGACNARLGLSTRGEVLQRPPRTDAPLAPARRTPFPEPMLARSSQTDDLARFRRRPGSGSCHSSPIARMRLGHPTGPCRRSEDDLFLGVNPAARLGVQPHGARPQPRAPQARRRTNLDVRVGSRQRRRTTVLRSRAMSVHHTRAAIMESVVRTTLNGPGPTGLDLACSEGSVAHRLLDWGATRVVASTPAPEFAAHDSSATSSASTGGGSAQNLRHLRPRRPRPL